MPFTHDNLARTAGLLLGLGAVAIALLSWQVSRPGTPGLDLSMVASPSVPLSVSPQSGFLSAADMRPGTGSAAARARLKVQNHGQRPAHLSLRAVGSSHQLARTLQVSVSSGGAVLYRGPVAGLHDWSPPRGLVPGGQERALDVRAWIPSSVHHGYQRRIENLNLQLLAVAAGPRA
jgi:hypothetical protein